MFRQLWSLLSVLALVCSGCLGSEVTRSIDEVLTLQMSLEGDQCGVVFAEATVSAADMTLVGPVPLFVAPGRIEGQIPNVPAGADRRVQVIAYDAHARSVYSGSALVDVQAGLTTLVDMTLYRNSSNCSPTGTIVIDGGIDNGDGGTEAETDAGILPGMSFSFVEAELATNGVIHFLDTATDRIHRFDLASSTALSPLVGSDESTSMAVTPDGSAAYLSYVGGRMEVFDPGSGSASFFAAAPETVSSMVVADDYLFTIDGSGAWDTQSIFDRASGVRLHGDDWRDTARSLLYSPVRKRVYLLNSGVSPTDLNMVEIDFGGGLVGPETDSPYHGDYSIPNPLRLLPDESGVVVGSGLIFNTADLTYRTAIGFSFVDIAFHGTQLYLVDGSSGGTRLRVLDATFSVLSTTTYSGTPRRLFTYGDKIVLVTEAAGGVRIRQLTP